MILRLLRCIAGFVVVAPAAASACSLAPGYRVPTNFELVQRADLIAIVQVDSGTEGSLGGGETADPVVRVGPMQVLKGVLPKQPLTLKGVVSDRDGTPYESVPTPLTAPHYSTLAGTCERQHFAKGSLILAMYERTEAGLRPISAPFARAIEDVESYDSLWVRTARRYVALQARATGDGLRAAVIAERDRQRARGADMEALAVAADLDAWLGGGSAPESRAGGWSFDAAEDRVSISARMAAGADPVSLTCRRNGAAIELRGSGGAGEQGLSIDGRHFTAVAGRLAFTPELRRMLEKSSGPLAMTVSGRSFGGSASDIFHKFALRCETLLQP